MPERRLERIIKFVFEPERSDPYGLDYKISVEHNGQSHSMRLSEREVSDLYQQMQEQEP